jgi:ABC-2 type transport system ATP-binding protein
VALGAPADLKRQVAGDIVNLGFADDETAHHALAALNASAFITDSSLANGMLALHVERGDENLPTLMQLLHQQNIAIKNIRLSRPSLDDVFLKLTGRTLRDAGDGSSQ